MGDRRIAQLLQTIGVLSDALSEANVVQRLHTQPGQTVQKRPVLAMVHDATDAFRAGNLAILAADFCQVRCFVRGADAGDARVGIAKIVLTEKKIDIVIIVGESGPVLDLGYALAQHFGAALITDRADGQAESGPGISAVLSPLASAQCDPAVFAVRNAVAAVPGNQLVWAATLGAGHVQAGNEGAVLLAGPDADARVQDLRDSLEFEADARFTLLDLASTALTPGAFVGAAALLVCGAAGAEADRLNAVVLQALALDVPVFADHKLAIERELPKGAINHAAFSRRAAQAPVRSVRGAVLGEFSARVNAERLRAALLPADARRAGHAEALRVAAAERFSVPSLRESEPEAGKPDLVVFWKQHDSGIYARRSDRMVEALLASGRFGRLLQFDAPMLRAELTSRIAEGDASPMSESRLVADGTVRRLLHLDDSARGRQRSFVQDDGRGWSLLGDAGEGQEFADFVAAEMRAWGVNPAASVALVFPVVADFPAIQRLVRFEHVVVDLVDDQRTWPSSDAIKAAHDRVYRETIGMADLVVTNCAPIAERFADLRADIAVIPNGAEENLERFADIARESSGITVGYVGDMRQRMDWALCAELVVAHQEWRFVFVGSYDPARVPASVLEGPNVTMTGPLPAEQALDWMARFSVAIIPHVKNAMTEAMNPLKAYQYLAMGIPTVSSDVANIDELREHIVVAGNAADFGAAIEAAARRGRQADVAAEVQRRFGWSVRAADYVAAMQRVGVLS